MSKEDYMWLRKSPKNVITKSEQQHYCTHTCSISVLYKTKLEECNYQHCIILIISFSKNYYEVKSN